MRTASSTQALGTRQAVRAVERSTIPNNIATLERAGLVVRKLDEAQFVVADRFTIFPATGYWRELEGPNRGYTAKSLVAVATAHHTPLPMIFESPADARDSGGTEPELNAGVGPDKPAEAPAGEPSSALLPIVKP